MPDPISPDQPHATRADPPRPGQPSGASTQAGATVVYAERLWVPIWYWVAGLVVAGLLSAEVHMGSPGVLAWLPYVILIPIVVWSVLHLSRLRIQITDTPDEGRVLRVGGAHIPTAMIDRVAVVPRTAKSAALGRQLDPAAFVQHRTWVDSMVVIVLNDPDDPTPYWLVSTRHPERVAAALSPQPS